MVKPLFDMYRKFLESKPLGLFVNCQSYKDLNLTPVIVHGDTHCGNIMWEIDEYGDIQTGIAAIVDWQTIHEGSPMSDLARFLVLSTDGVVRRQAENFAVDFYLECLTKEFDGDASKIPYTAEKLQKAYDYAFLFQATGLMGTAMFLQSIAEGKPDSNSRITGVCWDSAVQTCIHALEDVDRLLQGDMKDMYEKVGH